MQERLESAPTMTLPAGTIIAGRYEVVSPLARGGMGFVYRARQIALDRMVAIKVLPPPGEDSTTYQRFEFEAKASAALSHPNIVSVFDFGQMDDGRPFLIMELIDGRPLSRVLKREALLEERQAVAIFAQVCDGLLCAHNQGVIHRDLKPGNILLVETPSGCLAKLIDFGLAKRILEDQHLTQSGVLLGTPFYMSPEQCRGNTTDSRSDIYSLGCVLHESLAGVPPLQGDSPISTMFKHLLELPDPHIPQLAHISFAMKSVIWKCLRKEPEDRYQNAIELKAALLAVLTQSVEVGNTTTSEHQANMERAERALTNGAAAISIDDRVDITLPPLNESTANAHDNVEATGLEKPVAQPLSAVTDECDLTSDATPIGLQSPKSDQNASISTLQNAILQDAAFEQNRSATINVVSTPIESGALSNIAKKRPVHIPAFIWIWTATSLVMLSTGGMILAYNNSPDLRLSCIPFAQKVSPPAAFNMCTELGDLYFHAGNKEKSRTLYEQALSMSAESANASPSTRARVEANLGSLYMDSGQLERAIHCWQNAVKLLEAAKSTESPRYAKCLLSIAQAKAKANDMKSAQVAITAAITAIKQQPVGQRHEELLDQSVLLKRHIDEEIQEGRRAAEFNRRQQERKAMAVEPTRRVVVADDIHRTNQKIAKSAFLSKGLQQARKQRSHKSWKGLVHSVVRLIDAP